MQEIQTFKPTFFLETFHLRSIAQNRSYEIRRIIFANKTGSFIKEANSYKIANIYISEEDEIIHFY